MRTIEDMRKMVRKIQTWFKNTNPIASGRVVVSPDGTVGLFQEKRNITQNTKMSALKRAKIQIHDDIYSTINAHNYAKNTLREDQKTVIEVSDSVAALVAACMIKNQGTNVDEHVTTIHELVASITSDLEDKATFFYLEKMMIDYLLKLNGGQYDSTRVYWAAQTLQT